MTPERIAEILAGEPEGTVLVHATPAIDETCSHDWEYWRDAEGQEEPSHCKKCSLSWTRYIFCCMP